MRLNNFRIPAGVIGLTLMSGVAVLSFDPSTNAQGNRQIEAIKNQLNDPRRYDCYSSKDCGGKILSHRDPHNCRVKSHGKSCYDNLNKKCIRRL